MSKTIRIGTRESQLALWQANTVKDRLEKLGFKSELVPIKSKGDIELDKPLYELGITGIFTKTLDIAMLKGEIDIAVHSMKDVPTMLPKGIVQAAVLSRGDNSDVLIPKNDPDLTEMIIIATGSLRRKAQWLSKYPHHQVVGLRGNVNTRLKKLDENDWQGAIFAKAGLERIDILPQNHLVLDWMIPAPAQGAMMVVALENDSYCREALRNLNDEYARICTYIEREFLRTLEGGCTAPIGALAEIKGEQVTFRGTLLNLDGSRSVNVEERFAIDQYIGIGRKLAMKVLAEGGDEIMNELKKES